MLGLSFADSEQIVEPDIVFAIFNVRTFAHLRMVTSVVTVSDVVDIWSYC